MPKNTFKDEVLMAERLGAVQAQNERLTVDLKQARARFLFERLWVGYRWTAVALILLAVSVWPLYKTIVAEGEPEGCYVNRTYHGDGESSLMLSIDWRVDEEAGRYATPELAVAAARDVFHCRLLGE